MNQLTHQLAGYNVISWLLELKLAKGNLELIWLDFQQHHPCKLPPLR